jgi:uncharacterized protein YndB with AHSA1/START domain
MTKDREIQREKATLVRVVHRFSASAERVYDAWLQPEKVSQFLFATPTGRIVRCELDPRVGGAFTVVDRRDGEDVEHIGTYLQLERPNRIVFRYTVPKYGADASTVTIDIAALAHGCQLTLSHELAAGREAMKPRVTEGWQSILELAAECVVEQAPSCGAGVAQHATIPAKLAIMFEGLAETMALHRKMLKLDDAHARKEDEVYAVLAQRWHEIARQVRETAAQMEAQRELPMGAHDQSAWNTEHLQAFAKFVRAQGQALSLLRVAQTRDQHMLSSMEKQQ